MVARRWTLFGLLFSLMVALCILTVVPWTARRLYGRPVDRLNPLQVVQYSAQLLWADGRLTVPLDARGPETPFEVMPGESIESLCTRLEQHDIVADGRILRDYLIYTGQDTSVQSGNYRLSAAMSVIEVASQLQDATPTEVEFVVLPGWRVEEIAATLPTSGLSVDPGAFIQSAHSPSVGYDFLMGARTLEGYLYPGAYILPRSTGVSDLLDVLVRSFGQHLGAGLREGIAVQGLSVREAVILASIIQREAVISEESPLIASVYLNRLRAGMHLDADPTVQYALGFNSVQQTWWTNPLSLEDLKVNSPYNTYQNGGLPPAPIANPGREALLAVAEPAVSPYFYFNARCDASGYHLFSESFPEHLANLCQ